MGLVISHRVLEIWVWRADLEVWKSLGYRVRKATGGDMMAQED